ncbi:unnamed protein product [Staurois parvus]|uniref:Uncharacterized protein n=1 Tax=Staurois parvus TaxID=386267 RepID=A0ABN9BW55_9NEOB|nr:unnamed protein product [Staurois parvus]
MGPCTASSCCCQARKLPWAPRTDSSCCCQARNLSWPLYRLLMLLPGPECVMGPCTALPLLLSPSPHSAMCHFQVSSQLLVGSIFVIGCCMAIPIAAASTATLWLHTLVLDP